MEYKFTKASAAACLDGHGTTCPNIHCQNTEVFNISSTPSNSSDYGIEHVTCSECGSSWSSHLYAARIVSVSRGNDGAEERNSISRAKEDDVEEGFYDVVASPSNEIIEAITVFLKTMKGDSISKRGQALGRLAHIARVDINQLPGIRLEALPDLPSEEQ